jgi:Abnormal spindle-like microcephaly-assoc'd, ASPM-SPD-2-Hydin
MSMIRARSHTQWLHGAIVVSALSLVLACVANAGSASAAGGDFTPSPSALEFSTVTVGNSISREVTFTNDESKSLTFKEAEVQPTPPFQASVLTSRGTVVEPGKKVTVRVTCKPTAPGVFKGSLVIVTEEGAETEVTLSVDAEVHPELRLFPESLEVGSTSVGERVSRKATFANTGDVPLEVESVKAPSAPFAATGLPAEDALLRPGEEILVEVQFAPTSEGRFQSSLSLATRQTGVTELTVSGAASAAPSTTTSSQPTLLAPASLGDSSGFPGPPVPSPQPPPTLTHLQIRASVAHAAKRAHRLAVSYTLSTPGAVRLAIERQTVSHSCPRHARSCVRWLATKVKLDATGHAGHDTASLSLAGLAAGAYRLDATPLAHAGATGPTQRLAFEIAG